MDSPHRTCVKTGYTELHPTEYIETELNVAMPVAGHATVLGQYNERLSDRTVTTYYVAYFESIHTSTETNDKEYNTTNTVLRLAEHKFTATLAGSWFSSVEIARKSIDCTKYTKLVDIPTQGSGPQFAFCLATTYPDGSSDEEADFQMPSKYEYCCRLYHYRQIAGEWHATKTRYLGAIQNATQCEPQQVMWKATHEWLVATAHTCVNMHRLNWEGDLIIGHRRET